MDKKVLPEKTVARLSEYRRTLLDCLSRGKTHIFSYEIAELHHITAVQVRRDIMFLGYSSSGRRGYDIRELIRYIGRKIDYRGVLNVAVVGIGNYGRAISAYLKGKRQTMEIVAGFDVNPVVIDKDYSGIPCYSLEKAKEIIKEKRIAIAILTVPPGSAEEVADYLVECGIKGILNYTSVLLKVPDHVYLEEYDMITSLEKLAYYVKNSRKR
ncbi:MAG: redox-sensing transcriptional repressor Rex [Bacteroidota bacterium]